MQVNLPSTKHPDVPATAAPAQQGALLPAPASPAPSPAKVPSCLHERQGGGGAELQQARADKGVGVHLVAAALDVLQAVLLLKPAAVEGGREVERCVKRAHWHQRNSRIQQVELLLSVE